MQATKQAGTIEELFQSPVLMKYMANIKRKALPFLRCVIRTVFWTMRIRKSGSFEMKLIKSDTNLDQQKFVRKRVIDAFECLLEMLVGSRDFVPYEVRECCRALRVGVQNRFGKDLAKKFLAEFLFSQDLFNPKHSFYPKRVKRNFLISFEKEKNWKNKQKEITSNKK